MSIFSGWRNFRHFLQARHEWQREIVCPIRDSEAYDLRIRRQITPVDGLAKPGQNGVDQSFVTGQESVQSVSR